MGAIQGFGSGMATSLGYDSAGGFMDVAQRRMALANGVTGNESEAELAAIHQQDKALELQGVQDKFNYEYSQAWQEANERRRQKDREQRQRLFQMGAIFA